MSGNITRRGKSSWRLKFDVGRDPSTGKRQTRYETVKGTKKDAEKELTRLLNERNEGTLVEPTKITLGEFARDWLAHTAPATITTKTLERYDDLAEGHIIPALGGHRLQKLTARHIEAFYAKALVSGRRDGKGGLSPATVRHIHAVLRRIIRSAIKKQLLKIDPLQNVENLPRLQTPEIQVLSQDELALLLRNLRGTILFAPALLAAATGMRRGEVLGLRWCDIDFGLRALTVAQTIEETRKGLKFKPPKTNSGRRRITLPESVVRELEQHKREQAEQRLALGLGKDKNDLVFATFDGRPRVPRNFSREFTRAVKAAGLPSVTFHGLRHGHASHLLADGTPVKVVSERLGHANITITLQTYAHVLPGMQEDVAVAMEHTLLAVLGD